MISANAHVLEEDNHDKRADVIIKSFEFWQKCWADELNDRPVDEKATIKGMLCMSSGPYMFNN